MNGQGNTNYASLCGLYEKDSVTYASLNAFTKKDDKDIILL
jgi:hypothetical protein